MNMAGHMTDKILQLTKKKVALHIISVVIIVILSCINMSKLNYIAVLEDEFGYWGTAVSMAGYDWSELMSTTAYYAPGYGILLLPIITLLPNALWYKAAILLNIIFLVLTYFIGCSVGRRLFSEVDIRGIYAASLLVAIYPGNITYLQVAWGETLQYLMIWLITYLIVLLDSNFSYSKMVLALLISLYLYFIHNRNIGIWACMFACLILLFVKNKKKIWVAFLPLLVIGVGYVAFKEIKNYEIVELYGNSVESAVNNFEISGGLFSSYFGRLFNNFNKYLWSVCGKFFYIILGTCFTFFICIYCIIYEFFRNIKQKNFFNEYIISKFWCASVVIVMLMLTALQMIFDDERKDVLVYSRYFEHTMGPILLLGIIYTALYRRKIKNLILFTTIVFLSVIIIIQNKIENARGFFNSICAPVVGAFYDNTDSIKEAFIWIFVTLNIVVLVIVFSAYIRQQYIGFFLIIITIFSVFAIEGIKASAFMNEARASFEAGTEPIYDALQDIEQNELYYIKNKRYDPYITNPKYLQYMIPTYKIHVIEYEDISSLTGDSLVLVHPSDMESQSYLSDNVYAALLSSTDMLLLYETPK